MTNRFTHLLDRSRQLATELRSDSGAARQRTRAQLDILARRAQVVRVAIALAGMSVLLAALLIILIFISALMQFDTGVGVAGLFIACMLVLIASLLLFLKDVNLSLAAFQLEMAYVRELDDAAAPRG